MCAGGRSFRGAVGWFHVDSEPRQTWAMARTLLRQSEALGFTSRWPSIFRQLSYSFILFKMGIIPDIT